MTIKIAVAGKTNGGKTTLIRTLMRQPVGEVKDLANVTKKGALYIYEGLQAIFIDTPGFQYPSIALDYLDGEHLSTRNQEKFKYDLDAIDSIKQSDIVLYLANLSVVPDETHQDEVEVIKKIQPRIIGILNQYHKNLQGSSKQEVDNRCDQWARLLRSQGVIPVIIFDAHWDKRSKEAEIYDAIFNELTDELKNDFITGLNKFKKRQKDIQYEAFMTLAKAIIALQAIEQTVSKSDYYDEETKNKYNERIGREIYQVTVGFIAYIAKLYEVAAEFPTESVPELILRNKLKFNLYDRIESAATGSTFLGAFSAALGGIVGAVITGIASGGLPIGFFFGAVEGAKIFGAIGASLGSFAVFVDNNDRVEFKLKSNQIEDCFKSFLATVGGLDHNGFGRNKALSEAEVKTLTANIDKIYSNLPSQDWATIQHRKIIEYCEKVFTQLEKE
ncbi:GTPase [Planktothricoides raciborskii]|uniref:50S ribosome-binding GTPase n=1 Tax=Planktothricoides raciborskii FACHB-1370 TaxID=2949576 RepID=A0ABR8E8T6_9CYAN|nr:GTPase [Planktothricoides raciborskii]MBD2542842.1 50S ribosome-binding GTPase [Planktothricoides raciborskii FACHB-1370]MBD2581411.1 50S ribosome-binding GTPase [Planktothricoides raciborskii FACHB-1261]